MSVVFIPTRDRLHNLKRVLPRWLSFKEVEEIFLVVEPNDRWEHRAFVQEQDYENVHVIHPGKGDKGIGYTRNFIVRSADKMGWKTLIMSDDDAMPIQDASLKWLEKGLLKSKTLGYGACFSFYGLMLGNERIRETEKPYLVPGGMGYITFSLDVQKAMAIGNYDKKLHTFWEDAELVRQGMQELGYAWHVHTGTHCQSIGKRFEPGGLAAFAGKMRKKQEKECHQVVYDRWGSRYISHPDKPPRCRWQKMLDDFVPDWRSRAVWLNK